MTFRTLGVLFIAALVVRTGAAVLVGDAPYLDPAYYELVARRLASGEGFSVPVVWSFLEVGGRLPADPQLPIPSNGHWMPLTSILAAGSLMLFGDSRLAAQAPFIVLGALLVPATAFVAWDLWRSRRVALISGVLALFAGPMLLYVPMVDSFALFGMAGATVLYASARAVRDASGGSWLVLACVAAAVATLTRIDGLILGAAPLTAWLVRRDVGPWRSGGRHIGTGWMVAGVVLGAVVVAPWLARQWLVFGTPLPSAGGHTLWITSYNEQFSIGHDVNLGTYLAWGPINIIGSKLTSWGLLIGRLAVLLGGIFLFTFLFGLVRERGRPDLAPFLVYFVALFMVMGAAFTFHAPQGAFYHSAWAWLPFAIPLGVASFPEALERLGRHFPLFGRPRNVRFLLAASVVGAVVLSLVGSAAMLVDWRGGRERLETAATWLNEAAPGDVVMYIDAPSLHLLTGSKVVAPPFDPPAVIGQVAEAYGVRWVVVERLPGAAQDPLALWDGSSWLAQQPALDTDQVRIYEVQP